MEHFQQLSYIFFLHQTTTSTYSSSLSLCWVISSFYIKPQLQFSASAKNWVELYLLSTSNHNLASKQSSRVRVELYLLSTSNHNTLPFHGMHKALSYIFFLHQTTTYRFYSSHYRGWVISSFYIKPQQKNRLKKMLMSWVISSFYIKPQPSFLMFDENNVELYLLSTSNHNEFENLGMQPMLSYIFFLHQTTTGVTWLSLLCLLSYIFFLHQTTTLMSC